MSGSAKIILRPIAENLNVNAVLAITLDCQLDGRTNGEIVGVQTVGSGKVQALKKYLNEEQEKVWLVGYGDHKSDLPFLNLCDQAFLVNSAGILQPLLKNDISA